MWGDATKKAKEGVTFSGSSAALIFRALICEIIMVVFTMVSEIPQVVLLEMYCTI
jgi:hypothetical protein